MIPIYDLISLGKRRGVALIPVVYSCGEGAPWTWDDTELTRRMGTIPVGIP